MVSRQSLLRLVGENALLQAEPILAPLLELLSLARRSCDGDLDKFLIMLVVAIRAAGHRQFATAVLRQREPGETSAFPSLGVNIQSIADSIGAPKETVRRKVADLVELGWIAREGNELFLTPRAYQTLTPVREAIHSLAVRYHEVVEGMVAEAGAGNAGPS
jgi:hypothetical protein